MFSWLFIKKFFIVLVLLFCYYFVFKYFLKDIIGKFKFFNAIKNQFSKSDYLGAFEMIFLSLTHVLFCACVILIFQCDFKGLFSVDFLLILYSVILGVSLFGFSIFLCQIYTFFSRLSLDLKSWNAIAKSGWISHHFQCIKVFPAFIFLPVIFLQLSCEEFIFRGFLINYFLEFGRYASVLISTELFAFIQIFSMPSIISAVFPIIGAVVMALFHSYLFLKTNQIIPLMISHFCFFIFVIVTKEKE